MAKLPDTSETILDNELSVYSEETLLFDNIIDEVMPKTGLLECERPRELSTLSYSHMNPSRALRQYSPEELLAIQELLEEREFDKSFGNFGDADEIQRILRKKYQVTYINNETRQWNSAGSYRLSPESPPTEKLKEIQELLSKRQTVRAKRDHQTAERIREDLNVKYNAVVSDQEKEWWIRKESVKGMYARNRVKARVQALKRLPGRTLTRDREREVMDLLYRREQAKVLRQHQLADDISAILMRDFSVVVDTRNREWMVVPPGEYQMAVEIPLDNEEKKEIEQQIAARNEARKEKDFARADDILYGLLLQDVKVNDFFKVWWLTPRRLDDAPKEVKFDKRRTSPSASRTR